MTTFPITDTLPSVDETEALVREFDAAYEGDLNSPGAGAVRRLLRGNAHFAIDDPQRPRLDSDHRLALAEHQQPFAAIVTCSDSRVLAEVLFDQGFGDLFVIRTAGHVTADATLASVEYAVEALGVDAVIVLAHESCGAIGGTIAELAEVEDPFRHVSSSFLVNAISPAALTTLAITGGFDQEMVARENATRTATELRATSAIISHAVATGRIGLFAMYYSFTSGVARPVASLS